MPEEKRAPQQDSREPDYTPASPVKRTLAWIGLVYMVILLALTTYGLFTGTGLGNLGPLLTVPGLIGLAAICWLLALATLPIGIAGLMSNFGG